MNRKFDKIIFGAGIYGLYAAIKCAEIGQSVLVLERDSKVVSRATYVNQARVHMGYHYPRSKMTALKSANYFERFCKDFGFCIKDNFKQIYATSSTLSWTNAEAFEKFCKDSNIPCDKIDEKEFFKPGLCDGAFLTKEYTYDAMILKKYFLEELAKYEKVTILYNQNIVSIDKTDELWNVTTSKDRYETGFILNATYASINEIQKMMGFELFNIKYELCEIILCTVDEQLKDVGLTVMDGPFFSIMPFGKTGYHSLTSVTFTPHITSYDETATFECQKRSGGLCSPEHLHNCNECPAKPISAWPYMGQLAKKYMKSDIGFNYVKSLYSMKPILTVAEIDDSRPTMVKVETTNPTFVSVFSGKINTIYDLDEVILNE